MLEDKIPELEHSMRELRAMQAGYDLQMKRVNTIYFEIMSIVGDTLKYKDQVDRVLQVVSVCANIPIGVIKSNTRKTVVVGARQVMAYFLHISTNLGSAKIGAHCRDTPMDHATILYAIKKVEDDLDLERRKGIQSPLTRLVARCLIIMNENEGTDE